jgi:signal transduction histidine kinase
VYHRHSHNHNKDELMSGASDWVILAPYIAGRRADLVARCQQSLRATIFNSRADLRPSALKRLAEAEAETLLNFLHTNDAGHVQKHGGELSRAGIGGLALSALSGEMLRACVDVVPPVLVASVLEAGLAYQDALLQGYLHCSEEIVLEEQERIRSAMQRTISQYMAKEREATVSLGRAYDELREAERLRDDLTNMIVHDLRNPLTAVLGMLNMINRVAAASNAPDVTNLQRFAETAQSAARRMKQLIDDLLDVSKLEAGELRPQLAPLRLAKLLAERRESYRLQAEADGKHFAIETPPNLPEVMADAALIGRVLDNLIGNAFKYTGRGGHVIVAAAPGNAEVVVSVRDDGLGIAPEYHVRIFDKFVQVTDAYGVPLQTGTGLGLAFCRLAVQAHGGRVWVDSALGQGSTFSFTLPPVIPAVANV